MHILLIHQAFASIDEPGGTRHYELACFLADQGHRVTVIASPISYLTGKPSEVKPPSDEKWNSSRSEGVVRILRPFVYPPLHRSFFHRIINFFSFMIMSFMIGLRVDHVDVVWGTSPPIFQGITAWMLARFKRKPFLFEVRDLWPAFAVQIGVLRHPFLIHSSEWLERFLYRKAERVMVNSPGFIDHVTQRGARNVRLIPNGSDTCMFNPQIKGDSFRQEHRLTEKFLVLYAGAHGISNDLGILLDAADILRDRSEIIFVLLGDGKEKSALMEKAKKMELENVLFLPSIPKKDMPVALAAADVCVAILKPIPLYATVYPNKVFDYMAAGKPVVLAIEGVIRQVIEEAQAGILVSPGDSQELAQAILRLASAPNERIVMGRNGRAFVEQHFDRAIQAYKLEELLIEMRWESSHSRPDSTG